MIFGRRTRFLLFVCVSLASLLSFFYYFSRIEHEGDRRNVEADSDAIFGSLGSLFQPLLIVYGIGAAVHLVGCCCCTCLCTVIVLILADDDDDDNAGYLCLLVLIYCCCSLLTTAVWPITDALLLICVQICIFCCVSYVIIYIIYKLCVGAGEVVKDTAEKVGTIRIGGQRIRAPTQVNEESALPPMESNSFELLMRMLVLMREQELREQAAARNAAENLSLPEGVSQAPADNNNNLNEDSDSSDDSFDIDMNHMSPYKLLSTCLQMGGDSCFTFKFRAGPRNGEFVNLPKARLCPFCHGLNLRDDADCKHTTCEKCHMHFCHICLSTPNYNDLLFDHGSRFGDPTEIPNHTPSRTCGYVISYSRKTGVDRLCPGYHEPCRRGEEYDRNQGQFGLFGAQKRENKHEWSRKEEFNAWRIRVGKEAYPESASEEEVVEVVEEEEVIVQSEEENVILGSGPGPDLEMSEVSITVDGFMSASADAVQQSQPSMPSSAPPSSMITNQSNAVVSTTRAKFNKVDVDVISEGERVSYGSYEYLFVRNHTSTKNRMEFQIFKCPYKGCRAEVRSCVTKGERRYYAASIPHNHQ